MLLGQHKTAETPKTDIKIVRDDVIKYSEVNLIIFSLLLKSLL